MKVGNTTFGGGDPTMLVLQRELGARHGWLTPEQFAIVYSLARVTPGTNVLAFCAGAAWTLRGWWAALLAVLVVTIPSSMLSVWLTVVFEAAERSRIAHHAVQAVLAAVIGMMAAAVWLLLKPSVETRSWVQIGVLVIGAFLLNRYAGWGPVPVMFAAAVAGALFGDQAKS